jgi:hypothetical protein
MKSGTLMRQVINKLNEIDFTLKRTGIYLMIYRKYTKGFTKCRECRRILYSKACNPIYGGYG